MIHEDYMILFCESHFQCLCTGKSCIYLHSRITEKLLYYHKVSRVIVHHKYLCIRSIKTFLISNALLRCISLIRTEYSLSRHSVARYLLRNLHYKGRSAGIYAVNIDASTHGIYKLLNYGKAKAGALYISVFCLINSLKCSEKIRNALLLNTDTRI